MTDRELIEAAISQSGLTPAKFAGEVMGRSIRTVFNWRQGKPIPAPARLWLQNYLYHCTRPDNQK